MARGFRGITLRPVSARFDLTSPILIDDVARRHPTLTQVIVIGMNPRVFSDVSASWARPQDGFQALVRAHEWGVVDKLLFGPTTHIGPLVKARRDSNPLPLAARRTVDMPNSDKATVEHLLETGHLATLSLR